MTIAASHTCAVRIRSALTILLAGRYGACIGIPAAIYLFAQMPGKFSTVWVWKCHSDFGIRDASMGPGIEGRSIL
jgi:hypothetical protein